MNTPLRYAARVLPLLLAAGCHSTAGVPESHWNIESVPQRITTHFTGYRGPIDGSYQDFQWQKKRDINLTLRRHFLNNDPENPLEATDPNRNLVRPPFSVLPDPVTYFHAESLAIGALVYGASGTFVLLPVDSLIATFTPGGPTEFIEGIGDTLSGDWHGELGEPAPPSRFKVRHR
jgi:hypothetical protein